jgi:hypothetical protein
MPARALSTVQLCGENKKKKKKKKKKPPGFISQRE